MTIEQIQEWCLNNPMFKDAHGFRPAIFGWFFFCHGAEMMAVVNAANGELIGVWPA